MPKNIFPGVKKKTNTFELNLINPVKIQIKSLGIKDSIVSMGLPIISLILNCSTVSKSGHLSSLVRYFSMLATSFCIDGARISGDGFLNPIQ